MPQQPTRPVTDWATYIRNFSRRVIYVSLLIIPIIVFCITGHIDASSKTLHEELSKSNYTILGLTIGEDFRHDILSKLGPTLKIRDENDSGVDHLCYISDRDETLFIFSFKASRFRRFQMMSHKNRFYKWHFCEVSPLVAKETSTESGIILGMSKDRLKAILGIPKKESKEMLVFEYKRKKQMEKEELKKESHGFTDMNTVSSRTVSVYVEARFVDSELSSFEMSSH
jgi:hypothetical protein